MRTANPLWCCMTFFDKKRSLHFIDEINDVCAEQMLYRWRRVRPSKKLSNSKQERMRTHRAVRFPKRTSSDHPVQKSAVFWMRHRVRYFLLANAYRSCCWGVDGSRKHALMQRGAKYYKTKRHQEALVVYEEVFGFLSTRLEESPLQNKGIA